jgi:membrane associated rhomboid family serine protease
MIRRTSSRRSWASPQRSGRGRAKPSLGVKTAYAIGGAIAACLLVLLVALLHFWVMGRPLSASIGDPLTTLLIVVAALAGALIGWRYKAKKPALG